MRDDHQHLAKLTQGVGLKDGKNALNSAGLARRSEEHAHALCCSRFILRRRLKERELTDRLHGVGFGRGVEGVDLHGFQFCRWCSSGGEM